MFRFSFRMITKGLNEANRVLRKARNAERRVMILFGAYVRRTARRSIRRRKAISPPGSPPNSHIDLVRDMIFFVYDPHYRSVIIGPQLVSGTRGGGKALNRLEYGGPETIFSLGRARYFRYRKRPFMNPAFDRELPKLPGLWANSIVK